MHSLRVPPIKDAPPTDTSLTKFEILWFSLHLQDTTLEDQTFPGEAQTFPDEGA